jgi:alpha-amylase
VTAWDWRAAAVNLANVLTRRPEAYHQQLIETAPAESGADGVETIHTSRVRVKEPGLERLLFYDPYRRTSFLDHVLPADLLPGAFQVGAFPVPFAAQAYRAVLSRIRTQPGVTLSREAPAAGSRLRIEKQFLIDLHRPRLHALYRVTNIGPSRAEGRLGVEMNGPHPPDHGSRMARAGRGHLSPRRRLAVPAGDRLQLRGGV